MEEWKWEPIEVAVFLKWPAVIVNVNGLMQPFCASIYPVVQLENWTLASG